MRTRPLLATLVGLVMLCAVLLLLPMPIVGQSEATPTPAPPVTVSDPALDWHDTDSGVRWAEVAFDDIAPGYVLLQQCWNGMGMDDRGRVYIGFTSTRLGRAAEDFAVFRYDPASGERAFLGTFMDVAEVAGNLHDGESIPKGHTRMIFADGVMYMGSQGFHDLKWEIDTLPQYRGAHLFAFDTRTDTWSDLAADLPGGVVIEHEGIVALGILREQHLLVGLAHPSSDIVLFDYRTNTVQDVIPGIPWTLGNPLSRELIVTPNGHIYTYRGTEDPRQRDEQHPVWRYDLASGSMTSTGFEVTQGFWIGQTATRDGSTIYVSTTNGQLYAFDTASETFTDRGYLLPRDQIGAGRRINFMYGVTLSPDERSLYYVPAVIENPDGYGELYRYDLETGEVSFVQQVPYGIYTSADLRDDHHIYMAHFGRYDDLWTGTARLFVLDADSLP